MKRILVVDDNPDDRYVYRRLLSPSWPGLELIECETAGEGFSAYVENPPDCLLLDFELPDQSGLDLLERLRGERGPDPLPVIVLTGKGSESVAVRALQVGAQDYLSKDAITADTLRRAVINTIEKVALLRQIEARNRALVQTNGELKAARDSLERQVAARTSELQAAWELADRANRLKDEFLAMLSHELRNPLSSMRYALELIEKAPEGGLRSQSIAVLDRQLENLTRLVDDLLDVSRLTQGSIPMRVGRIDAVTVVRAALEALAPLAASRGQTLATNIAEGPIWVKGDATRLEQVYANLIHNAVKYTPAGGSIEVKLEARSNDAVFVVRDNGIGISQDLMPHVFDLFTQGNPARSEGGLGVGLTIVHSVVRMHGGTVQGLSLGPGSGAEFRVMLPLDRSGAPDTPADTVRGASPDEAPRRVLVVDDNADALESLSILLSMDGHEVRSCLNGGEALTAVGDFRPETVLLDIGLPDMDGYHLARRIRQDHPALPMQLIAVTGYGQQSDRDRARDAGFDHHLTKPVKMQVLRELLREGWDPRQLQQTPSGREG